MSNETAVGVADCLWNQDWGNLSCLDPRGNYSFQYHGVVDVVECAMHWCALYDGGLRLGCSGATMKLGPWTRFNPLSPLPGNVRNPAAPAVPYARHMVDGSSLVAVSWGLDVQTAVNASGLACGGEGALATCVDGVCFGYAGGLEIGAPASIGMGVAFGLAVGCCLRRAVPAGLCFDLAFFALVFLFTFKFLVLPVRFLDVAASNVAWLVCLGGWFVFSLRRADGADVAPEELEELGGGPSDDEDDQPPPEDGRAPAMETIDESKEKEIFLA